MKEEKGNQMTTTNIIGLPSGPTNRYFTEVGYSQTYPWKVVARSASGKTLTLREVKTEKNPDWKPEFHVGGFCAHCSNQSEQTWLYEGIGEREIKIRLCKGGVWRSKGVKFVEDRAQYFYDYNF